MALARQQRPLNVNPQPWASEAPASRLRLTFEGGINENTSPDPAECSAGYNFDLAMSQTALVPRVPFDLKGTAPAAADVTALMQLVTRANVETTLAVSGTKVYLWNGTTTFTVKATITSPALLRETLWPLGDYIAIADLNLNNVVAKWDGTTYGSLTTGLGSALYAKYAFVHQNRLWLFNIKYGSTLYPHMILVSTFETPTSFDITARGGPTDQNGAAFTTGLEAFYLFTPDMKAINGVELFHNSLIISTDKGHIFRLLGTSTYDFQFADFFDTDAAIGNQSIVSVGNDVIYVRAAGEVMRLFPTQNYGSVSTAILSHWIPKTTQNLSVVNALVDDIVNHRVFIFTTDKVLVLFKNLMQGQKSPWSVYRTFDQSTFNTSCAKYMRRPGTANYSVFFGDATGRIFDLNGSGAKDAGLQPVPVLRRSRHISDELVSPWPWVQENVTGQLVYRRNTPLSLTVALDWDDEYNTGSTIVALKGPSMSGDGGAYFGGDYYFGGPNYFNAGFAFPGRVSSINLSPGGKGPGFYASIYTEAQSTFQIDALAFT